jgi:hypothetical protein
MGRGENITREPRRPSKTRVPLPFCPGTSVPGFPMTPLRGWILEGFGPALL